MTRTLKLTALAGCLSLGTGCAAGARFLLFSGSPEFLLVAEETEDGVVLEAERLEASDFEDDLCDADDGESCLDDVFLGIGFYRSDTGPYGTYVELGIATEGTFTDTGRIRAGDDVAWRAGTLREEEEEDPRMDKVSVAAVLGDE